MPRDVSLSFFRRRVLNDRTGEVAAQDNDLVCLFSHRCESAMFDAYVR